MTAEVFIARACAHCEAEQPADRGISAAVSHGICRRHFIEGLKAAGFSAHEIKSALDTMAPAEFCEDLEGL